MWLCPCYVVAVIVELTRVLASLEITHRPLKTFEAASDAVACEAFCNQEELEVHKRGEHVQKSVQDRLGMGLSLVKTSVELRGLSFRDQSRSGLGSVFLDIGLPDIYRLRSRQKNPRNCGS
jgi:hypothetical protein